jgi:hypothetical protein
MRSMDQLCAYCDYQLNRKSQWTHLGFTKVSYLLFKYGVSACYSPFKCSIRGNSRVRATWYALSRASDPHTQVPQ